MLKDTQKNSLETWRKSRHNLNLGNQEITSWLVKSQPRGGKSALPKDSETQIHIPEFMLISALDNESSENEYGIAVTQYCNIRMYNIGSICTKDDRVLFPFNEQILTLTSLS